MKGKYMLTNEQKATAYREMGDRISKGWMRGNLSDRYGRVCMLGAAQYGVESLHGGQLIEMQDVMKMDLHKRHPLLRILKMPVYTWNDAPWRTRAAVIRFMRGQQRKYERLARKDLEARVKDLEARVLHLEQTTILTSHPDLIELQVAKKELADADTR